MRRTRSLVSSSTSGSSLQLLRMARPLTVTTTGALGRQSRRVEAQREAPVIGRFQPAGEPLVSRERGSSCDERVQHAAVLGEVGPLGAAPARAPGAARRAESCAYLASKRFCIYGLLCGQQQAGLDLSARENYAITLLVSRPELFCCSLTPTSRRRRTEEARTRPRHSTSQQVEQ